MITETIYEHLKELYYTKVQSILNPSIIIDPSDTLTKVIGKITENDIYDVFCVEKNKVLTTNIRSLLTAKDISDMKIKPFLYPIPSLSPSDTVQKAANIMIHYRVRSVPVSSKEKIIGAVNAKKILKLLARKDNKWILANLIYTQNPITLSSNDYLSTARKLMHSKRIDHLPIVDKGSVKQVITSSHLLQAISPQESLGRKSKGMKKITKLDSKIGNIGSTRIPKCTPNDNLNLIIDSMLRSNTTCCLVNLWDNLQGIITYRDILSLLAAKIESAVPLYIVGMPEDQRNVNLIGSKFTNTLKRLSKVYTEIQEAKVSVKQQRSGGKKAGKYEVSIMITTPHHAPLIYKSVGFDLSQVIEELSQKLLRNLSKRSKRRYKPSIRKMGLPVSSI